MFLFYLEHDSDARFSFRLEVEHTQMGITERDNLCLCILNKTQDDGYCPKL
jgi:hypothetical protein